MADTAQTPAGAPTSPEPGPQGDEDEINLLDLALVAAENLRLLILGPLAVGLLALGISFAITPTFTASTIILPPQQQQSGAAAMLQQLGALGGLAGAATGLKNPNDQFVALLKSRAVEDALIDRFKLIDRYEADFRQDARKTLENATKVSAGKDGLITIEFDDEDPAFAAEVANAYVEQLGRLLKTLAITEAQQRRVFFERQLAETQAKLTRAQQALQTTGVSAGAVKGSPEAAVAAVAELQARISAQEVKLGVMRGYLSESAPELRQALNELSGLRAQLAKIGQPGLPPGTDADYIARFRDFKYQETLFELFSKQYEIARVDEGREGAIIQVVDRAVPPERKTRPKKALIAVLTTLATAFVLLLWVFVRQALRGAAQDPASAHKVALLAQRLRRAVGRTAKTSAG